MSEAELEELLAGFDARARAAQDRMHAQRRNIERFRTALETWMVPQLEQIAARLERSGHEAEVSTGGDPGLAQPGVDPAQHVQIRILPRPLPGLRVVRPSDRQPLVRFQLDASEGLVRVWARDVSLDGREVLVGYRNDAEGQPLGVPLEAADASFVWKHVLETLDFALRESAQEKLFNG